MAAPTCLASCSPARTSVVRRRLLPVPGVPLSPSVPLLSGGRLLFQCPVCRWRCPEHAGKFIPASSSLPSRTPRPTHQAQRARPSYTWCSAWGPFTVPTNSGVILSKSHTRNGMAPLFLSSTRLYRRIVRWSCKAPQHGYDMAPKLHQRFCVFRQFRSGTRSSTPSSGSYQWSSRQGCRWRGFPTGGKLRCES